MKFNSWQGQEIFLFSIVSRPVLEFTQPLTQWVTECFLNDEEAEA
jgi:hypothetical protein